MNAEAHVAQLHVETPDLLQRFSIWQLRKLLHRFFKDRFAEETGTWPLDHLPPLRWYLGVVLTVNMMVGLITPPYGVLLFVISGLVNVPLGAIIREVLPFIALLIGVLLFMVLVPDTVTFLPRLLQ